jgi:hypothetical protein
MIKLMDERGSLLSKSTSAKNVKRGRDAFDIYYVLTNPRSDDFVKSMRALLREVPDSRKNLEDLAEYIDQNVDTFNWRVETYAKKWIADAAQSVSEQLKRIIQP